MIEKLKKNKIAVILIVILAVILVGVLLMTKNTNVDEALVSESSPTPTQTAQQMTPGIDPLNATYDIENQNVTLVNGVNEEQIPNSSTKIVTQVWGEPVATDIKGNEVSNPALILTQDPGGSGTFYYAAAAVKKQDGYYGTNGVLLGDRVAIQNQEIMADGTIVVNYAIRPEGAPMSDQPSEAVSKYFKIEETQLVEVDAPVN